MRRMRSWSTCARSRAFNHERKKKTADLCEYMSKRATLDDVIIVNLASNVSESRIFEVTSNRNESG